MKTSSILSAAIILFSVFAAASPVASSNDLVAHDDSAGAGIITALTSCRSDLTVCHNKFKTKCEVTCSQNDIRNWAKECSFIVSNWSTAVKTATPTGFKFIDPAPCVNSISEMIHDMNACLTFLIEKCGLVGLVWATLQALLSLLLGILGTAISGLLAVLAIVVDNPTDLIANVLRGLLSGETCYCCGLFGIPL